MLVWLAYEAKTNKTKNKRNLGKNVIQRGKLCCILLNPVNPGVRFLHSFLVERETEDSPSSGLFLGGKSKHQVLSA